MGNFLSLLLRNHETCAVVIAWYSCMERKLCLFCGLFFYLLSLFYEKKEVFSGDSWTSWEIILLLEFYEFFGDISWVFVRIMPERFSNILQNSSKIEKKPENFTTISEFFIIFQLILQISSPKWFNRMISSRLDYK